MGAYGIDRRVGEFIAPGGYPLYITDSQEALDNADPCSIYLDSQLINADGYMI